MLFLALFVSVVLVISTFILQFLVERPQLLAFQILILYLLSLQIHIFNDRIDLAHKPHALLVSYVHLLVTDMLLQILDFREVVNVLLLRQILLLFV